MIQFDEDTYHKLRHRAFEQGRSISSVARELVAKGLRSGKRKKPARVDQFSFVGAGRSKQGRLSPVSERHDEALAETWAADLKK
jgi:plasmid stability protein